MFAYGLVSFVQDSKIKAYVRFASRRGEIGAAVVGREDDLRYLGASAQECCDLLAVCVRGDTEVVDLPKTNVSLSRLPTDSSLQTHSQSGLTPCARNSRVQSVRL
jgi:hypothetical protein